MSVSALISTLSPNWCSLVSGIATYFSALFLLLSQNVLVFHTDGHNPHAHILLTVRPLNENGTWQYKTEKEYLCIKDGEEKGFTASEFKTAQKQGWEKQYRYKVGKKKEYLTPSSAQEKGYERIDKHPKSSRYGRQNPISEQ